MQESTSKEKILKKIRQALIHKTTNRFSGTDMETSLYVGAAESPEIQFAQEFTRVGGHFLFCENMDEFRENIVSLAKDKQWERFFCKDPSLTTCLDQCGFPYSSSEEDFKDMAVGLTLCENLIARTGSVLISSRQLSGRRLVIYPPAHVVLAYASQLVSDIKDGLLRIKEKYADQYPSMITLISGPSRTADIEKTLVTGAHGPKEIFVFLIDDTPGA